MSAKKILQRQKRQKINLQIAPIWLLDDGNVGDIGPGLVRECRGDWFCVYPPGGAACGDAIGIWCCTVAWVGGGEAWPKNKIFYLGKTLENHLTNGTTIYRL